MHLPIVESTLLFPHPCMGAQRHVYTGMLYHLQSYVSYTLFYIYISICVYIHTYIYARVYIAAYDRLPKSHRTQLQLRVYSVLPSLTRTCLEKSMVNDGFFPSSSPSPEFPPALPPSLLPFHLTISFSFSTLPGVSATCAITGRDCVRYAVMGRRSV